MIFDQWFSMPSFEITWQDFKILFLNWVIHFWNVFLSGTGVSVQWSLFEHVIKSSVWTDSLKSIRFPNTIVRNVSMHQQVPHFLISGFTCNHLWLNYFYSDCSHKEHFLASFNINYIWAELESALFTIYCSSVVEYLIHSVTFSGWKSPGFPCPD